MSDKPHRAAEVVAVFEAVARRLTERGDHDPLDIVNAAFAAVHARFPDLTAAEAERAAAIRQFNALSALFEAVHRRAPNTIEELYAWANTPEGRTAYERCGRAC
jgi:hypothetical protein